MLQYPVCPGHGAYIGMSPSGKAPDFDSGIRRFESCHPSQINDPLAQPVEQLPFKQWVRGSSPRRVTKKSSTPYGVDDFLMGCRGLERPALRSRAKNSPGDCFSGRGRVPVGPNASRRDVGGPTASDGSPEKSRCFASAFFNEICPSGK